MIVDSPRPITYIPIHGTWAIDEGELAWWKSKSNFANYAKRFNVIQYGTIPFIWTSDLVGVGYNFLTRRSKLIDWSAGGWALYYYLQYIPIHNRNIIAHSHGLQVILYCAAYGMKINNLISVSSPIRGDMKDISDIARPHISRWLHLYDASDKVQFLGGFGDGRLFGSRISRHADENQQLGGINHSDILKTEKIDLWSKYGWFDFLRQ